MTTPALLRNPVAALAARLGWSEGDAWTAGIGLTLALALAVSSIPAALRDRPATNSAAAAPAAEAPPPVAVGEPEAELEPLAPVALPPQQLLGPLATPPAPDGGGTVSFEAAPPAAGSPAEGATPVPPGALVAFADFPVAGAAGGVAVASDGRVHATTDGPPPGGGPSSLISWDASGARHSTSSVPGQPPARTRGVPAVASTSGGGLVAVDAASARVLRHDGKSRWSVLATVPDLPPCVLPTASGCQPGLLDGPPLLRGVVVDKSGAVFIADAGQGVVWRLAGGAAPQVWWSSAEVAGEEGLAGLALDADGHLLAAVTRLAGLMGAGPGALLRIERAADGRAGARTVVSSFAAGEDPVDVAVGTSSVHVALRGADAVVTLDADGVEQLRVTDPRLTAPSALALAAGRLYVTASAERSAVLVVGTEDRPLP